MADEPKTYTQDELDVLVNGLKANRDEALKEAKKAKDTLRGYEGVDPDEFKRLKTASEETARKRAAELGDFKSLESQLKEHHAKELETGNAKLLKVRKAMEQRLVQAELTKAIVARKGDPDLLLPHAERYVRVRETEDDFEAYVVDEKGHPLFTDGSGSPMNFDALVEQKLVPKYPRAFEGTGSSGGGAAKSAGTAGGGASTVIAAGDNAAFLSNLKGIATGDVVVR